MSTEEGDLKELAAVYRQLIEFKPFQRLVAEMKLKVENLKESNINNIDNDLITKGIVSGIRTVIFEPNSVIEEFDDSLTR